MNLAIAATALVAGSTGLSVLLCWIARLVAPRVGFVDRPGGRKAHQAPTPLGGGVAIWLTVVVSLAFGGAVLWIQPAWLPPEVMRHRAGGLSRLSELAWTMFLATLIMAMGLADDLFRLSAKSRFLAQTALALVFVLTTDRLTLFQQNRWVMIAVTVVWIVGLTNAFNFLDNMDGLAASVGLIAASLFVGAQVLVGGLFVPAVLLVLVGALLGFLAHNRPPARLFMGDAGSNFVGFMLGTLTVIGTFAPQGASPYAVLTPLLVMSVPMYDMASVVMIRLREGRSPFQADRKHFSHRLVERGLTPPRAVATIDLVTLAGGLGALLLHRQTNLFGAGVIVAQTLCLLGVVVLLEFSSNASSTNGTHRTHAAPNDSANPPAAAGPTDALAGP